MRNEIIIAGVLITSLAVAAGVYVWQEREISELSGKQSNLQAKVSNLDDQYEKARSAQNINTGSWEQYCDPITNNCFKYPGSWKFEDGEINEFNRVRASITNPDETVQIDYESPLVRDGGTRSDHIVELSDMEILGTKLKLIGSYPVSSGVYVPKYYIVDSKYADDLATGKIGIGAINSIFSVDELDSISFRASGPELSSSKQAEAWFDSVEGKTVRAIMLSFGSGQ